jgi:hypothetical protein
MVLTRRASRTGAFGAVYGFCGGWVVYFISAATGTGGMFPMASGRTRGSPLLEGVTSAGLLTVALALFALCGVVLKHLHTTGRERSD